MSPNAPRRRGRGRPPNYVKDAKGNEVVGLSPLPVRNKAKEIVRYRYYATYSKPRVYFGYDCEEAIAAFTRWQSEQKGAVETLPSITWNPTRVATEDIVELATHAVMHGDFPYETDIPESTFWKKVAEVFATNEGRRKAAKLTGYKMIRMLDQPDEFARPLSLREVGKLMYGKRDDKGKLETGQAGYDTKELRKSWNYWQEFCKAVGVANVHEVTREAIAKYREFVYALQDGKISARTIFNRYNHISSILNNARDRRENHTETIDKLRDGFQVICRKKRPKVETGIPTPIDVEDFSAMFLAVKGNTKWKSIVLLSMNCGLHPGECTGLNLDSFVRTPNRWKNRP